MKILALDLSTKSTGYAIFDNKQLINYDCLTASSKDPINRIKLIIKQLDNILLCNPDIEKIILEEVHPTTEQNSKSIHTYKILMYLQAALTFLVHEQYNNIPIIFIYPSEWRSRVGIHTGRSITREQLKQDSINFVKQKYNINVNDDIADAISLGYAIAFENKKESAW